MKPEVWGPKTWFLLHSVTLEYPENPKDEDKQNFKDFIQSFQKIIPCLKCRENFKNHLTENPLTSEILATRQKVVKWMIDVHNSVNKMTNKPILTYEEALTKLLKTYSSSQLSYSFIILCIIIFISLIVLIIIIKKM